MRLNHRYAIAATAVFGLAMVAAAIVPGVETTGWPWVGKIGPLSGYNTGAVAVGDHWLLTARHVTSGNEQMRFQLDSGLTYDSIAIYEHPTDDISLVQVTQTFPGWYDIYWSTDQLGKTMEMVGYGVTGTWNGSSWTYSGSYGTKRRGRNRVSLVQYINLGTLAGDWLICDFDGNGVDSFGDGGPLTDEATLGGLDSGAPSFIEQGGVWKVAGIHSWVGSETGGPQPPQYGSLFGDIRVGTYRAWFDTIVPAEVLPTAMNLFRGQIISGQLSDLYRSDDSRLVLRPGAVFSSAESPIQLILDGTSPVSSTAELRFAMESSATSATISRKIELFNFQSSAYQTFSTTPATTGDSVTEVIVTSNPSRFIHPLNRTVRARISARATSAQFAYPWLFRLDRAVWNIRR
ncbi:MAG: trypsin-like serine protease [Armatimonadetes bacterium]|nr:trypsin-like serine protease [Armatimonadota bacterium]